MNKLIFAFAFVAVFAVAASAEIDDAETQLALFSDDDGETKGLVGNTQIFRQFCLDSREKVRLYLKNAVNEKASSAFKLVADLFTESATAVGTKSSGAVQDGTVMIQNDARMIANVLKVISNAIYEGLKSETTDVVQRLKQGFNTETFVDHIQNACRDVTMNLKRSLEDDFRKAQNELKKFDTERKYRVVIAKTKFDKLGCTTTSRVNMVARSCEMINIALPSLRNYFASDASDADSDDL